VVAEPDGGQQPLVGKIRSQIRPHVMLKIQPPKLHINVVMPVFLGRKS